MLIHFSEELADEMGAAIESGESIVHALQNLAQARVQGDHILTGDSTTLSIVAQHPKLSSSTKEVFKRVAFEQAQFGALRHRLTTYIEISGIRGKTSTHVAQRQKIIRIPLNRFERNDITQPTFLIAENLLDCQLFLRFSSWFAKQHWNGQIPSTLSAVFVPGGGDTTDRVLNHFSQEQRYLALGITDSDIRFPSGKKGQTSKKCEALTLNDSCHHIVLPVRSAENLLSVQQIEAVLRTERERKVLLGNLERLLPLWGQEAWKHLPLKDGVRVLIGPCKPGTEEDYWNKQAPPASGHPDGYLLPGISPKLLQWAVDHIKVHDPEDLAITEELHEIWKSLALLIASWACATSPMRA